MVFVLACSASPPLAEQWERDPEATRARIAAMPSPERRFAIDAVTRQLPGSSGELCELLETGADKKWCNDRNHRPHLWTRPREHPPLAQSRAGGGPTSADVPEFPELPLAAEVAAGADVRCDGTLCRETQAKALVRAGAWQAGIDLCAEIGDARWRDECVFSAAETAFAAFGQAGYRDAAALCSRAGAFEVDCQRHLLETIARHGHPDTAVVAATWKAAPAVASWAVDHVRAKAAPQMAELGGEVSEEFRPYVRMERALSIVQAGTPDVAAALSAMAAIRASGDGVTPIEGGGLMPLWPGDAPGEDSLAAITVRGRTRRTVDLSPEVDRRICVLEAAAASRKLGLVEEGLHDPDAHVRWTAARLLTGLGVGEHALLAVAQDSDPLVRARATGLVPASTIGAPGAPLRHPSPVPQGAGEPGGVDSPG